MFLKEAFFYQNSMQDCNDMSFVSGIRTESALDNDSIVAMHQQNILNGTQTEINPIAKITMSSNQQRIPRPVPCVFDSVQSMNECLNLLRGDLCCRHCTLPAKEVLALAKPIHNGIKVKAYVCSFACMIAYATDKTKTKGKYNKYIQYIMNVFSYKFGKSMSTIETAPPITRMVQFGGSLSQQQYREILNEINARIQNIST